MTLSAHNSTQPDPAFSEQERQFRRAFSILREAISRRAFPGASLAVTHRGALVASQGFGNFLFDPRSPEVRPDTVFDVASLTKVVATTTMAMLLYERGKLSLDGPVSRVLPEFVTLSAAHQHDNRKQVTIRMLLAHSSGLPAYKSSFSLPAGATN